jgi:hypothetical protein
MIQLALFVLPIVLGSLLLILRRLGIAGRSMEKPHAKSIYWIIVGLAFWPRNLIGGLWSKCAMASLVGLVREVIAVAVACGTVLFRVVSGGSDRYNFVCS